MSKLEILALSLPAWQLIHRVSIVVMLNRLNHYRCIILCLFFWYNYFKPILIVIIIVKIDFC